MEENLKQLLLKDLCARLPYGVKVYNEPYTFDLDNFEVSSTISKSILEIIKEGWKPYLRSMSSMTEEEHKEYEQWLPDGYCIDTFDWLNKNMFDYRGLIPMGLGIDCTGLNVYENEKSM